MSSILTACIPSRRLKRWTEKRRRRHKYSSNDQVTLVEEPAKSDEPPIISNTNPTTGCSSYFPIAPGTHSLSTSQEQCFNHDREGKTTADLAPTSIPFKSPEQATNSSANSPEAGPSAAGTAPTKQYPMTSVSEEPQVGEDECQDEGSQNNGDHVGPGPTTGSGEGMGIGSIKTHDVGGMSPCDYEEEKIGLNEPDVRDQVSSVTGMVNTIEDRSKQKELELAIVSSLGPAPELEEEIAIIGDNETDLELQRALSLSLETPFTQSIAIEENGILAGSALPGEPLGLDRFRSADGNILAVLQYVVSGGSEYFISRLADVCDDAGTAMVVYEQLGLREGHSPAQFLSDIAEELVSHFDHLEDLSLLEKALEFVAKAREVTEVEGNTIITGEIVRLLDIEGGAFYRRFEFWDRLDDIEKAITAWKTALNWLGERGAHEETILLNNLGNLLLLRFERLGNLADVDEAILRHKQAVGLIPDGHADKPSRLNNLGNSLLTRFKRLGNLADIDEAILRRKQAVDLTPDGHADKPSQLINLGNSFLTRFQHSMNTNDLRHLISSYRKAALSHSGPPSDRFYAARQWARFSHSDLGAYHTILDLIPQVVWLGRTVQQRYEDLKTLGDVILNAVSAACTAGKYDLALEWLEHGRAIIWGQLLHLRSPMDDLQAVHPDLFDELNETARALERASTSNSGHAENAQRLEEAAQAHRRLAEKWEALLVTVRELPGFTDFLRPKPASTLQKASDNGVVVVVNVSEHGGDALVLSSSSSPIERIALSKLSLKKATSAQNAVFKSLRSAGVRIRDSEERATSVAGLQRGGAISNVLAMLWHDLARPILDHLGFDSPLSGGPRLRITWCLAGPLASLPVHAAGIYDHPDTQERLFNYVMSSYTPSLTSLLEGLEKTSNAAPSLLAITQQDTPNLSRLPGTIVEVNRVQGQMNNHGIQMTRMDDEQATIAAVSQAMATRSWVHLACHGKQDASEPTKSAFFLHDGRLELAEIMKKPLKHAELAYLSACQTASGDEDMPNEAAHLAAGMFTAGYRSVVATLWSIGDKDAPIVAEVFYDRLLSNPNGGVAGALHDAVDALRKKVGEENFISWVPYIHIGH